MDTVLALIYVALTIFGGISGAVVTIFIRRGFSPSVALRVTPRWIDDALVVLTLEIENISPVRVAKDAVFVRVQEHDLHTGLDGPDATCVGHEWVTLRSPWVPDSRESGAHCSLGPSNIFETTVFVNPKETLQVERIYGVGASGCLHVGLQLRKRFPWWVEQLDRITRRWNWRMPVNERSGLSRQQTATFYVCRGASTESAPP